MSSKKEDMTMIESVFLEVTRECNLQCIFCSNKSYKPLEGEFTTDELLILIDDLHRIGIRDLRFYGGEPFLKSDLFRIIGRARSYDMAVSIYTNGTIFSEDILIGLKKHSVRKLFLSVDSASFSLHDKIRGVEGSFDKVVANIETLIRNGLRVDVLLTICRINKDGVKDTYHLLRSLGVNDVKANFVSNVGKAREHWDELSMTVEEIRACVKNINEIHSHLFGRLPMRKLCQAGTGEIFIAANGDVFPCALFLDDEYRAGNIRNRKLPNIIKEPEGLFGTIRDIIATKKYCPTCEKKDVCGGGCRARAVASHNGNMLAPDIASCIFHKEITR